METKSIYCCECVRKVDAFLVDGRRVYPHRGDLADLPFWECPGCGNHVGCHHKTENRTQPLGCIPSPAIRKKRLEIHALIDPLWKSNEYKRYQIYNALTKYMGFKYHTAQLRTVEECEAVIEFLTNDIREVLERDKQYD